MGLFVVPTPVLAAAPTVTVQAATVLRNTTATANGNITATGGANVTARGFQYDIDSGVPYSSNSTENGNWSSGGAYTRSLTSLSAGTRYYIRAFATNADGTSYSSETTFYTTPTDAYWVGGTGTWSDDDNHWAQSSNGTPADGNIPGLDTNTYFNAYSVNATSKTITISANAYTNNMDWTGVTNNPTLSKPASTLYIYGSLTLSSGMSFVGSVDFSATSPGKTITTNGVTFDNIITFNGIGKC